VYGGRDATGVNEQTVIIKMRDTAVHMQAGVNWTFDSLVREVSGCTQLHSECKRRDGAAKVLQIMVQRRRC
jgi:hypothetical protein